MPVFRNNQTCLCAAAVERVYFRIPTQSARHIPPPLLRTAIGIGFKFGLRFGIWHYSSHNGSMAMGHASQLARKWVRDWANVASHLWPIQSYSSALSGQSGPRSGQHFPTRRISDTFNILLLSSRWTTSPPTDKIPPPTAIAAPWTLVKLKLKLMLELRAVKSPPKGNNIDTL